jgi:hypothetical protein
MKYLVVFLILLPSFIIAQKTTILKGTVRNKDKTPIENVSLEFGKIGTVTDKNGNYSIRIPYQEEIIIKFSHISYRVFYYKITAKSRNSIRYSPILLLKTEKLA